MIQELRRLGHDVDVQDDCSLGRVCAAGRSNGLVSAAITPRYMQNYALTR